MSRSRTEYERVIETQWVALTGHWAIFQELFLSLLLLQLDAILSLQPTLRRNVLISLLVFFKLRKEVCKTTDGCCFSFFRRVVRWRHPSKCWTWCKKHQQIWGKFIRHCDRYQIIDVNQMY